MNRLLTLLALLVAGLVPRPSSAQEAPAAPPAPADLEATTACIVADGEMRVVDAFVDPDDGRLFAVTDDEVRAFSDVYSSTDGYAYGAHWYTENEPVVFMEQNYSKYGLPRELQPDEAVKKGMFDGVPIFVLVEDADLERQEILYLPHRSGCEFQPYVVD